MKKLKYIFMLCFVALGLVACNSEDNDYDIEYTAIHPLGGTYKVIVTADGEDVTTSSSRINLTIANTIDNDADKCWIRIGTYNQSTDYCINGKISCNVAALTFSGSNIENLAGNVASSTETFTITDGKLELKGATAPSGTIADKVTFTYTTTKNPGVTYRVEGYRYTGWPEDNYKE
jgi:hypothetical protein